MSSWIRPGTVAEALTDSGVVIVDRATAQVVRNDLKTNALAPLTAAVPEIEAARASYARQDREAERSLRPGDAPLGKAIIVMNSGQDRGQLLLLLYPHPKQWAAVIRLDQDGKLTGRFHCLLPSDLEGSLNGIEADEGYLVISSTAGEILRYKL
jgi:hypothetical protein